MDCEGNIKKRIRRDTTGKPPGNAPAHLQKKRAKKEQVTAPQPPAASMSSNNAPAQYAVSSFNAITSAIGSLYQACKSKVAAAARRIAASNDLPRRVQQQCRLPLPQQSDVTSGALNISADRSQVASSLATTAKEAADLRTSISERQNHINELALRVISVLDDH